MTHGSRQWTLGIAAVTSILVTALILPTDGGARPLPPNPGQSPTLQVKDKPPETIVPGESCVSAKCHTDYMSGKFVHGPTSLGMCQTCHENVVAEKHVFRLIRQGAELCSFCHDPLPNRKFVHGPLNNGLCTACHDPHRSEFPYMLKHGSGADLCYECHEPQRFKDKAFTHAPIVSGQCLECHDPHSSWHPAHLRKPIKELCYSCHSEFREKMDAQSHWHPPVQEDCTSCHDPHTADHENHLSQSIPELCWSCHKDVKGEFDHATNIHKATQIKDLCLNCHDAHASQYPRVLKQSPLDTCLSCHSEPIDVGGDRPLLDMKKELSESQFLHGPILQGNCSACHRPHAASTFRRLVDVFPAEFYAPFELDQYGLCFKCHDKQLVLEAKSDTLTRFRNGEQNLHYLHVNKEKKGRTCRACHAIHGSNHPFHIRDTVPFGGWEIPINFVKTEDGGTCTPGCHAERKYGRSAEPKKD